MLNESLQFLLPLSPFFPFFSYFDSCSYTGFNSTLRQGNITHHEYIQVWHEYIQMRVVIQ